MNSDVLIPNLEAKNFHHVIVLLKFKSKQRVFFSFTFLFFSVVTIFVNHAG
jgi:hypothetical protein